MYLLFLSVIATPIIALLVWYIIKVIVFGLILKHVTKKEWRKAINMLISYLRQRTDLIMFRLYMVSMTTIVGIIPPVISLCIQYRDQSHDFKLNTNLENEQNWIQVVLGSLITIVYLVVLYFRNKDKLQEWEKEQTESAKLINETFSFSPNKKWFEKQNNNAIVSLGHKYSQEINYPNSEMPHILACTDNDAEKLYDLLREEYSNLIERWHRFESSCSKSFDKKIIENVGNGIIDIVSSFFLVYLHKVSTSSVE